MACSVFCQAEEIQVQCENDFKRFNPSSQWYFDDHSESKRDEKKTAAESADELLNYHITVEDLIRVYSELGLVLPPEIAEEMLFDADISGDGGVAYDDLIRSDFFWLQLWTLPTALMGLPLSVQNTFVYVSNDSCIETIGTNEVYHVMKTSRSGLRAIQEMKLEEQFKSAMGEHGTTVSGVGLFVSHRMSTLTTHQQ